MKLSDQLRGQLAVMMDEHIHAKYGSQMAAAYAWGVTPPFVSKVVSGQSLPTDAMMEEAGITLVAVRPARRTKGNER